MSLNTGLTNYWKCDESSGNLSDSVGGITLTNNGTTPFAAAKINNGIDFGTTNTTKFFTYTATSLQSGGAFSVNLWVKVRTAPGSGTNQIYFLSIDSVSDTYPIIMYRNSGGTLQTYMGRSRFGVADDVVIATNDLGTANFFMLTVTYDGSLVNSFVNGVSVGTTTSTGNGVGASTETRIGSWITGTDWALAYIDEIGLWNRALFTNEVGQLYNGGYAMNFPLTSQLTTAGNN